MTGMYNIHVEITTNKKVVHEQIKQPVDFTSGLNTFVQLLRATQKLVNSKLTEVVSQETSKEMIADEEDNADDDDEDSDVEEKPDSTAKRKSEAQKNSKKIKV